MFYVDNNSGSPNMPALSPAQSNTPTWFTEGDKNKGISWIGQDWLNILQAELLNILAEAGITPDKGKLNQLTLSIKAIITANAYTQANNLKEILDAGIEAQAAARGHLGLGKLATKDGLGAGDVDAVSKANGGTFDNNIAVTGAVTSNQMVVSVNKYPGFTTSVSAQSGSQAPFYLGQVTLGAGDIFIPYIKESTVTTDGKKAVVSFGFNKNGIKPHASPAVHVATEDGKYQLWEFDTETGRLINNTTGGVALLSELAPVKKAIDDTQTGLAVQSIMWISTADDLSNLPSGAHRFARNNTGVTVLPAAGYFFIEVLAKRDVANGSCILATSDTGNVWIGLRYTAPTDTAFTWIQLNQNVENLGLTETIKRALNAVQKNGDTMSAPLINTHMNGFRLKQPGRSFFWRFDGANLYLLRTAINDPDGGWDGARPMYVNADSGQVFLGPDTKVNGTLYVGNARVATDGNIYGTRWNANGAWLWDVIAEQLAIRDNNINARATIAWANQSFISNIFLGAERSYTPISNTVSWTFKAPAGNILTGIVIQDTGAHSADNIGGVYYKPIQKIVNGVVMTIAG
ncbi:hypothetical protein RPH50_001909 [Salmonella enterica]|nr:hypothetical protein [Salmonella enterica]